MNLFPKVILLLETSRVFGRGLLYGIAKYSKVHGPWSFYREPRSLESAVPHLSKWNANGIIMRNSNFNRKLLDLNLPTIIVLHETKRPANYPVVLTESKKISQLAAEHLLGTGLRNFAYCGFDDIFWSIDRKHYFQQFINDAGYNLFVFEQSWVKEYKSWEKKQFIMAEWLKTLPNPVGIMACNDDLGQFVLEACKIAGLQVPEEVSVIGVDNDALICDLCDPPLTSVALNTESAGYNTAELLNKLMNGEPMQEQEIIVDATHIVRRQSTDIMAVNNEYISEAIRFIRQNTRQKIRVNDVVAQTSISRRSLESYFRKILHRSIQEEIRRIRIEQIAEILIETDLTISEITSLFHFTDVEHISRYFRREKGLGLREYRKKNRSC